MPPKNARNDKKKAPATPKVGLWSNPRGGRPAKASNVGKFSIDMVAVQYGQADVLLPGYFQDEHVLKALRPGQVLRPLKEGHVRKMRAIQQAIDEFTEKGHVQAVPPQQPEGGHVLFKSHGKSWHELQCGDKYAGLLERTVELYNDQLTAVAGRDNRRLTLASLRKNLCELAIEMNEKAGLLKFNHAQWNARCYRLVMGGVGAKGSSPVISPVMVNRLPAFYRDFGSASAQDAGTPPGVDTPQSEVPEAKRRRCHPMRGACSNIASPEYPTPKKLKTEHTVPAQATVASEATPTCLSTVGNASADSHCTKSEAPADTKEDNNTLMPVPCGETRLACDWRGSVRAQEILVKIFGYGDSLDTPPAWATNDTIMWFGQVSTQKAHVPIQPGDEVKTEPAAFQSVKTELEQSVKTELETAAAAYDCDGYELGQGSLAALDLSVFLVDEASGCSVYVKQEQAWG